MKRDVRVFGDAAALTAAACETIVGRARAAIAARRRFDLVLSGGRTPEGVYRALAGADVDWKKVHAWFGDERCVPPDHADSNHRMARAALLGQVPLPPANVHRIAGEKDAYRAAEDYELEIRRVLDLDDDAWPRFDLILLGMGADGHTASLFPDTTALEDESQLCCATWVESLKTYRVTLTFPVLNHAAAVLFLATGADKGPALRKALAPTIDDDTPPAGRVRPVDGELAWFLDRALASAAGL